MPAACMTSAIWRGASWAEAVDHRNAERCDRVRVRAPAEQRRFAVTETFRGGACRVFVT